ncbi:uncharacterized protein LTR77_007270 [Saxophila tyrrhenica]|uniref:protein-tyrosine-phosphatase n=1 Tax=Saxophila tyrrhenica TaxID=1690608 RepID=A0AAV9P664_9PEZI|nr:hypothetical protein LTR77_007270 [Saxophila tyrrhenica]
MGWLDQIPKAPSLYIGGLHALYQKPDLFAQAGITHIVSALDFDIYEAGAFQQYEHLHIRLDDDPNENLLAHFSEACKFIEQALEGGGAVFVHCAMGKSRSATICCAYLMQKFGGTPDQALMWVCEGRPVCDPNPGFKSQLLVWRKMLEAKGDGEADEIYQTWLKERWTGDWWSWDKRHRETKL